MRVEASGRVGEVRAEPLPLDGPDSGHARSGARPVWFGGWRETPIYARERLRPGNRLAGPAVVEQMDSTAVILPGQEAEVDGYLNLVVHV